MLDCEKRVILGYLRNIIEYHGTRPGILLEICEYFGDSELLLGEPLLQEVAEARETAEPPQGGKMTRKAAVRLGTTLGRLLHERCRELEQPGKSPLETNLEILAGHLGLAELEKNLLGLMTRHLCYGIFRKFMDAVSREHLGAVDLCAACLAVDPEEIQKRLRHDSLLVTTGLVHPAIRNGSDLDDQYSLNESAKKALHCGNGQPDTLLSLMIGLPLPPALDWEAFDHLGPVRDKLCTFLGQALRERTPGVNILFWGAPGTGKTELCKTLAHRLGCDLYAVGEVDDDGNEPSRLERMASLRLTQNLLRAQGRSLALFDEMDDLLKGDAFARLLGARLSVGSKVFINRLLENNPLPTLWVINDVRSLDESFIRRMSLVVEVKNPPTGIRSRFLEQVLEQNGMALPADQIRRIVDLNITPAVVAKAADFARRVGGLPQDFTLAIDGTVQAINGGQPVPPAETLADYRPELVNADLDLGVLAGQLVQLGPQPFSLCLYGPPGTGKSAYLRHLAERMGMPVMLKRASDLLDKYVGESEKNIARAFHEAAEAGAFLVFDEADSLLGDRREAARSWEVSQVNEMLTWMERHPLPFACTTNLMERLDQASMRRFTFKSCFGYLRREQALAAFQYFFGCGVEVDALPGKLTPGDFAVVQRKARILGRERDALALGNMLGAEAAVRQGVTRPVIGFDPGGVQRQMAAPLVRAC